MCIFLSHFFCTPYFEMESLSISPWMDSTIWRRLPPSLLDRVIVFLPPHAFFRLRSVSKRWYSLLFSPHFLNLHLHLSPPLHHSFIFFHSLYNTRQACIFDPDTFQWRGLPTPLLPQGFSPVAASGGLVCWISADPGPKTLLLSNPLTGALTCLPASARPRLLPSVGLHIDRTSLHLVVAGDDLISPYAVKNLTSESFHRGGVGPASSMWGPPSPLPRLCSMEPGGMAYEPRSGLFYSMSSSPYTVVTYDVCTRVWARTQAPMRRFLRSPGLVGCAGRVVLVAGVEKNRLSVPKSVRVWVKQDAGGGWEEVERMPQDLYKVFEGAEVEEGGRGFYCVGNGEFVLIVIRGDLGLMLLLHLRGRRWVWAPPCPYVRRSRSSESFNGGGAGLGEVQSFAYEGMVATGVGDFMEQITYAV